MRMKCSVLCLFFCIFASSALAVETGRHETVAAMFVHASVAGNQMSISYYGLPDNGRHSVYKDTWLPMALVVLKYIRLSSSGTDTGPAGKEQGPAFGVTSSFLNQYLGDKMQLEFQADPRKRSGALVLKIGL